MGKESPVRRGTEGGDSAGRSRHADPSIADARGVAQALGTDPQRGLSAPEASSRLSADGRNELRPAPRVSLVHRILAQCRNPLVYLLLAAIAISLAAWSFEGSAGWPVDAIVIAIIVIINAMLGYVQEARAENAVAALAKMTAATASVVRDGLLQRVPAAELVRGDVLVLAEGDAVGADARLMQSAQLRVREASLTGESEAVLKDAAALAAPVALADRANMVFKGTSVVQGTGRALVTATGMQTEMGRIAAMLEATEPAPTPLEKEVAHIGRALGMAVVAVAGIVVATVLFMTGVRSAAAVADVLLLGVALAVAAVPEGLPAILSLVLALGVQRMAQRNAIVKQLTSVETLGSASVICSDKTGTLTRSEMTIQQVATASGNTRVSGVGYAPVGRFEHEGRTLAGGALLAEDIVVVCGGSAAGNADLHRNSEGGWEIEGDPTEAAFLVAERKLGASERRKRRFERVRENPFTSERKMMSTIEIDHERGGELVLIAKGAPDVLLERCNRVREGMAAVPLDGARRDRILADVDAFSEAALRTLAVAYRPLRRDEDIAAGAALEHDLIFAGTAGIIDPPREEAAAAIREAQRAGIRVVMITGDHPRTAARIAADLGIAPAGAPVLRGFDIEAMSDEAFARAVRDTAVYARVVPRHKLRIVDALQADGHVVAMTGDGVNDAPALKSADIGIAMGVTGTEVTKEAASLILADDNFATIVAAVREGRAIFDNIRKSLRYLLSSNMGEVLTVLLGVVLATALSLTDAGGAPVPPLLATQILWINLVTDSGPALAMGVDPEARDVMARKPRRAGERVIDARMWGGVLEVGAIMAVTTLLTIDLYLPGGLIDGVRDLENARTAGFTVLVFAQIFNCFIARSERVSAFRDLFANRWLWGAAALSVLLQLAVVHTGFLNAAFDTAPLDPAQWVVCLVMASAVLWLTELRKWLGNRRRGRGRSNASPLF